MTLKVHHLRPAPGAKTEKTRKGRGEASKGKTSGRGTKGTGARKNVPAHFEGGQMPLDMRLPKLKDLDVLFPEGGTVGPLELAAAGAVRKGQLVKILGDGDVSVKLDISAHKFSGTAKTKIEQAGGTVTVI
jgi:large subunit ribosomal protein L15